MTELRPAAVVASTEKERLSAYMRLSEPFDYAVSIGRIQATKIAGSWLFHPSTLSSDSLVNAALGAADELLSHWFIVPMPILSNMVAGAMQPNSTGKAARALLRELIASQKLARLGLLSVNNEPFLAVFRQVDAEEVAKLLQFIRSSLSSELGYVRRTDLTPPPSVSDNRRAWADTLLGHAEYAGWGRMRGGILSAWPAV